MRKRWLLGVVAVVLLGTSTAFAATSFDDVVEGAFYDNAASWAKANGVTFGCDSDGTKFCPDDAVTRAQNVTFAYRYHQNVVEPALDELRAQIADTAGQQGEPGPAGPAGPPGPSSDSNCQVTVTAHELEVTFVTGNPEFGDSNAVTAWTFEVTNTGIFPAVVDEVRVVPLDADGSPLRRNGQVLDTVAILTLSDWPSNWEPLAPGMPRGYDWFADGGARAGDVEWDLGTYDQYVQVSAEAICDERIPSNP